MKQLSAERLTIDFEAKRNKVHNNIAERLKFKQKEKKKKYPNRVFNSCLQIDQKIPGVKLMFTKSNNPYFILDLLTQSGETVKASIMPYLKTIKDENDEPIKRGKRQNQVKHLKIALRWPFGDINIPQSKLEFDNINQLVKYLRNEV